MTSMSMRSNLCVGLAAGLGLIVPAAALAQTYVEPNSRYEGAGGEVVVYTDTTDGVEINCTTGSAACIATRHVQLDPSYQDAAIFVTSYLLSWDRPGASADDPRTMGFTVDIANYDSVTGQLDWTARADFLGENNTDISYFLEVTILLANKSSSKVMEFRRLSTTCNGTVNIGNCSDEAVALTPPGMEAIAAPVRTLSVSSGSNKTRVKRMGFDTGGLTPGPVVTHLKTICELLDGDMPQATHGFTCSMDSILVFADLSIINQSGLVNQSDLNISLVRTWFSSSPNPGLGAVFSGLIAHSQDPNPSIGARFLFTRGDCAAAFGPPSVPGNPLNVEYTESTVLADNLLFPSWEFDARIVCLRVEVN